MLKGSRITLKPFDITHTEKYREWINDREIMYFLNRACPVSDIQHRKWYEKVINDDKTLFFSIFENTSDRYIGNIWLWDIDYRNRKAELRVFIGEKALWGTNMGTEAMYLLIEFAMNSLNLNKIYAYVHKGNPRGKNAFIKVGFIEEGILREEFYCDGKYEDVYRMAYLRTQRDTIKLRKFQGATYTWFQNR